MTWRLGVIYTVALIILCGCGLEPEKKPLGLASHDCIRIVFTPETISEEIAEFPDQHFFEGSFETDSSFREGIISIVARRVHDENAASLGYEVCFEADIAAETRHAILKELASADEVQEVTVLPLRND